MERDGISYRTDIIIKTPRFITKIIKDNVICCKELMKIIDLRYLDGVKWNFGIADGKDYGGSASVKGEASCGNYASYSSLCSTTTVFL